jgi:hypothetical protein
MFKCCQSNLNYITQRVGLNDSHNKVFLKKLLNPKRLIVTILKQSMVKWLNG